ncbi:MAG: TetR family transcriptional regulator [Mesorhizobium sp.]|nr:TetR/AcrR family transcriptional regulator [Mesorhizobium sp.]MCO5162499.1 TetR family transcriptional regulator [Mesorhizobium sp.]
MASAETRQKILDAAESLFTQHGINGVSLREIATSADIRISHLQYHFKTREDLYYAVFERRIRAINEDRLARLASIERDSGYDDAHLEDVVRALVEPMVMRSGDTKSGGANYATLLNQVTNEPADYARRISREFFDPIARITIQAFAKALPELDMKSLPWIYIFAVGAMTASISRTDRVKLLSDNACDPLDVARTVSLLVPFVTGGMRAVDAAEKARNAVAGGQEIQAPKASSKSAPALSAPAGARAVRSTASKAVRKR